MKTQTVQDMMNGGASEDEAGRAFGLFEMLKPGLRVKRNGRIDTTIGDKTPLGLYRSIMRPENYEPKPEKCAECGQSMEVVSITFGCNNHHLFEKRED